MTSATWHEVPAAFNKLLPEGSSHIQVIKMTNPSGAKLILLHVRVWTGSGTHPAEETCQDIFRAPAAAAAAWSLR